MLQPSFEPLPWCGSEVTGVVVLLHNSAKQSLHPGSDPNKTFAMLLLSTLTDEMIIRRGLGSSFFTTLAFEAEIRNQKKIQVILILTIKTRRWHTTQGK